MRLSIRGLLDKIKNSEGQDDENVDRLVIKMAKKVGGAMGANFSEYAIARPYRLNRGGMIQYLSFINLFNYYEILQVKIVNL